MITKMKFHVYLAVSNNSLKLNFILIDVVVHFIIFAARCYAQVLPMPSHGVCMSVRPSHLCILSKRINIPSEFFYYQLATQF